MKLILGTAQFGDGYGIKNRNKKIDTNKIINILDYSKKNGINYLDTALDYKFINKISKIYNFSEFKIINKISYKDSLDYNKLNRLLLQTIDDLNQENFHCIHLHQPSLYTNYELKKIYNFLNKLKSDNIILNIGLSIYHPNEFFSYIKNFEPDIVQGPLNIFDRRIINSGLINILDNKGISFHARSIFLQGLLLMKNKNKYFDKWKPYFNLLEKLCDKYNLDVYEYLINFVKQQKKVDSIIFGVDNINQIKNTRKAFLLSNKHISSKLVINDDAIINPSNWRI